MDPLRRQIVDTARTYEGLRWRHQGRSKATGVDCGGLVICVGHELGLLPGYPDIKNYGREPDPELMGSTLREHLRLKSENDLLPGDVVWLRDIDYRWPCHLGIITDLVDSVGELGLIHSSWWMRRSVREHRLDESYIAKIACAFAYQGAEG